MRVCMVTLSYPRFRHDFAGTFVRGLATGLVRRGLSVTVVCPHEAGLARREMDEGVEVRRFAYFLPYRLQKLAYGHGIPDNLRRSWAARLQVPALAVSGAAAVLDASEGADVLHAFWTISAVLAAPAARLRRIPMTVKLLGTDIRSAPRWLNRLALRACDAVECGRGTLEEYLEPYGYGGPVLDIKHMPDYARLAWPVELEPPLASWCRQAEHVVTFIARLADFKDPLGFLAAAAEVLRSHGGTRFLVVGDGPLEARARSLAARGGIDGAVRFTGARGDVGALLRASTVFVANSPVSNCYSTCILEAMHVGVPVALTDVGDPTGSFKRKDYVELARPRDPADLARAIVRLLDDPALRERRALMGRQFLIDMGFDEQGILDRTIRQYEQLRLHRRRRARRVPA